MLPRKELNDRFKSHIAKAQRVRTASTTFLATLTVLAVLGSAALAFHDIAPDTFAQLRNLPSITNQQLAAASSLPWLDAAGETIFNLLCPLLRSCPSEPQLPENAKSQHTTPSQNVKQPNPIPPAPTGAATTSQRVVSGIPASSPPQAVQQPVIERIRETVRIVTEPGANAAYVDARIAALSASVQQQMDVMADANATSFRSVSGLSVSGLSTSDIGGFAYATASNFVHIATWGDSITAGYGGTSYPTQLSLLTGYSIYDGGYNGETSSEIKTRMIAATGKNSWPTIIWAGRNNYADPTTVKADIAIMVASLTTSNYIVLSVLNGTAEPAGNANYDAIIALNSDLASIYGSHYLDIRAYLVSQYDPSQAQDITDHSNDVPPTSLRFDTLHPNTAGYSKIAQYLQSHIDLLVTDTSSALLTTHNLAQFANTPPTFGWLDSLSGYLQNGTTVLYASSTKYSTLVGFGAAASSTGLWNTAVGYQAMYAGPTSNANDAFGYDALYSLTSGANNAAFGVNSLGYTTSGARNIAVGGLALYNNTTASDNTAVGFQSLTTNSTGASNTAVGSQAMYAGTTSAKNTAVGKHALRENLTGTDNVSIGYQSSYQNLSATSTVAIGSAAAMGTAAFSNQGGVAIGYKAGNKFSTGSDYNTLIGYQAGFNITTGAGNILVGSASTSANANVTTGYNNISIGNNIKIPSATGNNQLNIGNLLYGTGLDGTGTTLSTGSVGVGTTTPWRKLSVTGTVGFDGLTGSTGAGSLCLDSNKQVVYNSASDNCLSSTRTTKHDIEPLSLDDLAIVNQLRPVTFIYNEGDGRTRYGFIAEDAAAVDAHLATYDASSAVSGIDDRSIIAILVAAVKDLAAKVSETADLVIDTLTAHRVETSELCVDDVCVTREQFANVFANQPGTTGARSVGAPRDASDSDAATADTIATSSTTASDPSLAPPVTVTPEISAPSEDVPPEPTSKDQQPAAAEPPSAPEPANDNPPPAPPPATGTE